MTNIIDGKALSGEIRKELKEKISAYHKEHKAIGLAVVLVGEDPASRIYVKNKIKACEEVGIRSFSYELPATASQKQVEELVGSLAEDDAVTGILVQLPLPKGLDADKVLSLIPTRKDVDGFSAENMGKLAMNDPSAIVACTPHGVMKMLEKTGVDLTGKNAVVIGRSNIVGKPMAMLLTNANATVTLCHSRTRNLKEICAQADILVAAIGKPKFVKADMVKEGAIVIDVGMDRDENGKLCGDVDFEAVKEKTSFLTPVPGGVGPMTITMLMYNTFLAAKGE